MARLKDTYKQEIVPAMMKKFNYKNIMQVPKLEKVVINMGMGDIKDNPKLLDSALEELATISGQAPVVTYARKSVANFKVREGMKIGAKVTIRGDRMYEFVDKLVSIAIPRVRTSAVFPQSPSTAEATMQWASRSSSCSLKSTSIRLRKSAAWISSSLRLRTQMKRRVSS